jgi:hypothetical protein
MTEHGGTACGTAVAPAVGTRPRAEGTWSARLLGARSRAAAGQPTAPGGGPRAALPSEPVSR